MSEIVWYNNGSRDDNKIALTFDDGPNPYFTLQVLDILKTKKIPATFFLLGVWLEKFPNIGREIINYGYTVGNHSYSHKGDFDRADKVFKDTLNLSPEFLRMPYGMGNPEKDWVLWVKQSAVINQLDKKIINFDVVVGDWKETDPQIIAEKVLNKMQNGSIILLHDGSEKPEQAATRPRAMVYALPIIIDKLIAKGFSFVTPKEMLLEPIIREV